MLKIEAQDGVESVVEMGYFLFYICQYEKQK